MPIGGRHGRACPVVWCHRAATQQRYGSSARNFPRTTLKSDNVFGNDGGIYQLATVTGNANDGYVANLTIGV